MTSELALSRSTLLMSSDAPCHCAFARVQLSQAEEVGAGHGVAATSCMFSYLDVVNYACSGLSYRAITRRKSLHCTS